MSDTTPMRERLARALFKADSLRGLHHYEWEDMPCVDHDEYFTIIDAILSELEKPTPEMTKSAGDAAYRAGELITDAGMEIAFTAAIRAAKETK